MNDSSPACPPRNKPSPTQPTKCLSCTVARSLKNREKNTRFFGSIRVTSGSIACNGDITPSTIADTRVGTDLTKVDQYPRVRAAEQREKRVYNACRF